MESRSIKILLIEDNPGDERLLREMLKEIRTASIDMTCVASLHETFHLISYVVFDLLILDLNLPDSMGLATFIKLHESAPNVPVVVLSGMDDESIAVGAVQAGAQDYLMKGEVDGNLLIRSIRYAIERHAMSMALRSLSLVDELTGLYNRRGFLTLADQQLKMAERLQQKLMLIFADLDGLKWINDNLGHAEGDLALKATATVFKETFRESDIVARFGGDEFLVLVLAAGGESAETVTKRLTGKLEEYNDGNDHFYKISVSLGIAHYDPEAPSNLEELLERADRLMYERKREKRSH